MTGHDDRVPEVDEQFKAAVVSDNVYEADRELWLLFGSLLGNDPMEAWKLTEVTHVPETDPETGKLTGRVISTAAWKRDPNHPTPDRVPVVAEEEEEPPA